MLMRYLANIKAIFSAAIVLLVLTVCKHLMFLSQPMQSLASLENSNRIVQWKISSENIQEDDLSKTIFFHETSGTGSLNFKQSCSLESAARHNPNRPIKLFMLADVRENDFDYKSPWLYVLTHYPNVTVYLITGGDRLHEFFFDSPLEDWLYSAEWPWSRFRANHLAQYMKLVNLYRNGGLFLDLDFVTTKRLDMDLLWNALVFEDDEQTKLSSSMFHLERNHKIIDILIESLVEGYDVDSLNKGSSVLLNLFVDICIGSFATKNINFDHCHNVSFLSKETFFPIPYWSWNAIFRNSTYWHYKQLQKKKHYGIYTWHVLSQQETVLIGSNQFYTGLATQHCPVTANKHNLFPDVRTMYP